MLRIALPLAKRIDLPLFGDTVKVRFVLLYVRVKFDCAPFMKVARLFASQFPIVNVIVRATPSAVYEIVLFVEFTTYQLTGNATSVMDNRNIWVLGILS